MESSLLDDCEFSLPTEFLSDDDILVEKENKDFKGIDYVSGFGSLGLTSELSSPVESLFGSTETDSDEEAYIDGLTRQMVYSTLEDGISGGFGNFPTGNSAKGCSRPGSPQSPLCAAGISCACKQRSVQNRRSLAAADAAWDMYFAAAEDMTRVKIDEDPYGFNNGSTEILGPQIIQSPVTAAMRNPNFSSDYYCRLSFQLQNFQALKIQHLKQHQMMKHRQLTQNIGWFNGNNNGGSVAFWLSEWSNMQQLRDKISTRSVFVGNPTGKRGSAGTGVFLPRRASDTASATTEFRNKAALPPARLAQPAVQLRSESQAGFNDASLRVWSNNGGFFG